MSSLRKSLLCLLVLLSFSLTNPSAYAATEEEISKGCTDTYNHLLKPLHHRAFKVAGGGNESGGLAYFNHHVFSKLFGTDRGCPPADVLATTVNHFLDTKFPALPTIKDCIASNTDAAQAVWNTIEGSIPDHGLTMTSMADWRKLCLKAMATKKDDLLNREMQNAVDGSTKGSVLAVAGAGGEPPASPPSTSPSAGAGAGGEIAFLPKASTDIGEILRGEEIAALAKTRSHVLRDAKASEDDLPCEFHCQWLFAKEHTSEQPFVFPGTPREMCECHVDGIVAWMKLYPAHSFTFWVDNKLLHEDAIENSLAVLNAVYGTEFGKQLTFRDIWDLDFVGGNKTLFSPDTPVYFRTDIFRQFLIAFLGNSPSVTGGMHHAFFTPNLAPPHPDFLKAAISSRPFKQHGLLLIEINNRVVAPEDFSSVLQRLKDKHFLCSFGAKPENGFMMVGPSEFPYAKQALTTVNKALLLVEPGAQKEKPGHWCFQSMFLLQDLTLGYLVLDHKNRLFEKFGDHPITIRPMSREETPFFLDPHDIDPDQERKQSEALVHMLNVSSHRLFYCERSLEEIPAVRLSTLFLHRVFEDIPDVIRWIEEKKKETGTPVLYSVANGRKPAPLAHMPLQRLRNTMREYDMGKSDDWKKQEDGYKLDIKFTT